jgi:starvation-inducible DNA-binding protein
MMMKTYLPKAPAHAAPMTISPAGLNATAVSEISASLNATLADMFALFFKTKNFHWHMTGPHFREYHLLLDEQAAQIFAATDPIAERVRKLGGTTLRSMAHASRLQHSSNSEEDNLTPLDMLSELLEDNRQLIATLRVAHDLCDQHGDSASTSLIENWIDEAEERAWFLVETIA